MSRAQIQLDHGTVDLERGWFFAAGQRVRLTTAERGLLAYLAERDGTPVSRGELLQAVWEPGSAERVVDSTVKRLRRKLREDGRAPRHLLTEYGSGYRLVLAPPSDPADPEPPQRLLDTPRTRFVGRASELGRLEEALAEAPVVALCGPGGIGKSRLALRLAERWAGEVTVVVLEGVDAEGIAPVVARALGLPAVADPAPQVGWALAHRDAPLLVLDGVEEVAERVGALTSAWSAAAPETRFLVTTRVALVGHRSEPLGPLLPADAEALFASRAAAATAGLPLLPDEGEVGVLVARLDGHPLAIELCANRLRSWTFRELAADLEGAIDGPGEVLFARSWAAETPAAREALAVLALLVGPLTRAEARAVVAADQVDPLVERGWLTPVGRGLRMFGVLRQFVAAQGAPSASGRSALAAWLTSEGQAAVRAWRGAEAAHGRARGEALTPELVRVARDAAECPLDRLAAAELLVDLDAPVEAELALAALVGPDPVTEGARRRALGRARVRLIAPGAEEDLVAGLAAATDDAARLALARVRSERGLVRESAEEERAVAESAADPWLAGQAWLAVAAASGHLGEFPRMVDAVERAQDAFRRCGSRRGEAQALERLASWLLGEGRLAETVGTGSLAVDLLTEEGGERVRLGGALAIVACAHFELGDLDRALAGQDRAVALCGWGGAPSPAACHRSCRALTLAESGRFADAEADLREARRLVAGHPFERAVDLFEAMVRLRRSQVDRGASLLARYLERQAALGLGWVPTYGLVLAGVLLADGDHPDAAAVFAEGEARLVRTRQVMELAAVDVHRAHLAWARRRAGDPTAAAEARALARADGAGATARLARAWLRQALGPDGAVALAASPEVLERLARRARAVVEAERQ